MYITNGTRPDGSYAENILAQAASNPGCAHWEAAKHLVCYLKGMKNYQLTFGKSSGMFGYTDASHASEDLKVEIYVWVCIYYQWGSSQLECKETITSCSINSRIGVYCNDSCSERTYLDLKSLI